MWKYLLSSTLLFCVYCLTSSPKAFSFPDLMISQNPPAKTYQPGPWQPVARIDLNRPVKINLINQTALSLDYAITEVNMEPQTLKAEETATLDNINVPLYIVIYPDSSNPDSSRINLKYSVKVDHDNIVSLTITKVEDSILGNRTFNLQETGAIYLY